MPKYSATFLGTGTSQGVPVITCDCEVCLSSNKKDKRLRTSILVSVDDKNIVIDTGPDFRQQMLSNQVKMVDAVLFTHEHKDHVAGLDDIRSYNFKSRKDMAVYASPRVQKALKNEYSYIFADYKYPGIPQVKLHEVGDDDFMLFGSEKVTPVNVMHYKLPVKAYRIGDLSYVTDANYISKEEKDKIKGSKVLVLNALRKEHHISHFSLSEAIRLIDEVKPKQAYLTHISHLLGLHDEVEKELPRNVSLAYDGLKIDF